MLSSVQEKKREKSSQSLKLQLGSPEEPAHPAIAPMAILHPQVLQLEMSRLLGKVSLIKKEETINWDSKKCVRVELCRIVPNHQIFGA